ncbi:hypothetical protein ABK040_004226 [Willaertia magna]
MESHDIQVLLKHLKQSNNNRYSSPTFQDPFECESIASTVQTTDYPEVIQLKKDLKTIEQKQSNRGLGSSSSLKTVEVDPKVLKLRSKIKELKARKLVGEYEIIKEEKAIQKLKQEYEQTKLEANESFERWILASQETVDAMLSQVFPLNAEEPHHNSNKQNKESNHHDKDKLWAEYLQTRKAFLKLVQFIELRKEEIEELERLSKNQKEEQLESSEEFKEEIKEIRKEREEIEERTSICMNDIIELKKEIEMRKKNIHSINEKIKTAEANNEREIQLAAKRLFK